MRKSNYDKFPAVSVDGECFSGWDMVSRELLDHVGSRERFVLAIECYSGVSLAELENCLLPLLHPVRSISTLREAFKTPEEIDQMVSPDLGGDDPVFGFMTRLEMTDLLRVREFSLPSSGLIVIYGPGAALCAAYDAVIYADMPRWEEQMRQRRGESGNLGVNNAGTKASLLYKRSFFIDWRICDRLKKRLLPSCDFLLDTTVPDSPRLISGETLRHSLKAVAAQPFRVVPFFDPGPWGGQWMKEVCDLDRASPNYAWCFDCVPEENSLRLKFGDQYVEMPASNLVFYQPEALLGEPVFGRFGAEFPIRFDFLDTMGGGNLSFQVHPLLDYARDHFGLSYTQDESYYLLDAGEGATVFLGLKEEADIEQMLADLEVAAQGGPAFDDNKYAAKWSARTHDHFLIPAGTCHCSGANTMVLEISHTPYIFTFKMWDWNRLGLDGKPRPLNIQRARHVIRPERREQWVKENLINRVEPIASGDGWREERTGLYRSEFIETRRHWFTKTVEHHTHNNGVHVLNLVQGESAIVESPTNAFPPFEVHYAETFIIPSAVGAYRIRPKGPGEHATLKAFVRVSAD